MAQRLEHQRKRRRGLSAARIEEMIARLGRAPIGKHPFEPSLFEMLHHQPLRDIGEPAAGERSIQQLRRPVESELAFHPHPQLAAAFLELPGIDVAMRRQTGRSR